MRDHRDEAFKFHKKMEELRRIVLEYNHETDAHFQNMTKHTKVDVCFFYREVEDLLDEMRKECLARREKVSLALGAEIVQAAIAAGSTDTTCVGNFATAKVDIKTLPVMPKRNTPEYQALLRAMGVADEIVDAGVLEPHFVRLGDYLTTKAGAGLTPFKDVLQVREQVNVTFRKKK